MDGYGETVTDPEKLQDALQRGLETNRSGKPALIDVIRCIIYETEEAVVPTAGILPQTLDAVRSQRGRGRI